MDKRNRRHGHDGNRLIFWGVPLMALVAALGMVYLHLHGTCTGIGQNITRLEREYAELRKEVLNEEHHWVAARYIGNMEALLDRHGLQMSFPEPDQVIRLNRQEPVPPTQYARQGSPI